MNWAHNVTAGTTLNVSHYPLSSHLFFKLDVLCFMTQFRTYMLVGPLGDVVSDLPLLYQAVVAAQHTD